MTTDTAPTETVEVRNLQPGDRIVVGSHLVVVENIEHLGLTCRLTLRDEETGDRFLGVTVRGLDKVGRVKLTAAEAARRAGITTDETGWHRAVVWVGATPVRVIWRDQQVTCCASEPLNVADGLALPAWVSNETAPLLAELRPNVTQCPRCGTLIAADYTTRRLNPEAFA